MKVIIILGGGQNVDGTLPEWVIDRCKIAIKIYNSNPNSYKMITTSAASYHNPILLDNGFPVYEATSMANYLISNGVSENSIYKEWTSFDTIGNIYFSKTTITDIRNWYDLIIITSDFHMKRSKMIADYLFPLNNLTYNITYLSVNHEIDIDFSKRIEREDKSIITFKNSIKNLDTLDKFHEWLYTQHDCYKSVVKNINKINTEGMLY